MKASNSFILYLFVVCLSCVESEFFTKTNNKNIPRMGRRSDHMPNLIMPNLIRRVAKTLQVLMLIIEEFDGDENGELSPEELMSVPFIQNAIKSYIEARELQELPTEHQELSHKPIDDKE